MERPGEVETTGVKQFLGEGFSFKYPENGQLNLQGENDWAKRTLTISGPQLSLIPGPGEEAMSLPSFEYFVEVFDNPEELNGRAFARQHIQEAYNNAREAGGPLGAWPIDEQTGEMEGRHVRLRGLEAYEARFFSGDGYTVRTFAAAGNVAVAVGYTDMPESNNPLTAGWRATWLMALDSVRLE